MNDRYYWVGLGLVKGIGTVRTKALIDHFGSAKTAWCASKQELIDSGLNQRIAENLNKTRSEGHLEATWERIEKGNIQVLTLEDEGYPKRLKEINNKPAVLYVLGELTPEDDFAIGIVGTRRVTSYGRQVAMEVSSYLARNGLTVISGMARGVDGMAHKSCLEAGGRTIAVLGTGVDVVYPPEHRKLAEKIIENGALVSDYAPSTPPEATNFPPRNRLISGLSKAVVVVEAGHKSGAMITAKFAADQGREVFAVPGNINAPQSRGTNQMIQDGAYPLLRPEDILSVLDLEMIEEKKSARVVLPGDAVEAELYSLLTNEPQHIDEIGARSDLSIEEISSTLTIMELKGLVRQLGGMRYVAVRESQSPYHVDEEKD